MVTLPPSARRRLFAAGGGHFYVVLKSILLGFCFVFNPITFLCYISRFLSITTQLNATMIKLCALFHAPPSAPMILASLALGRTKAAMKVVGPELQRSNPVHGLVGPRAHILLFGMSPAGAGPMYG